MATRQQDCLRTNCIFSSRHDRQCKSTACTRLMSLPSHNPIRISPVHCAQCKINDREATAMSPDVESRTVVAIKQS
ncbi:hypothetical protein CVT24_010686 [Panaeolus cyanescens]|uniref:Uncharacterized protein n=1 Tax=Panaeolus cyanescens TaxID=181874 RepID=A0A409WEB5_9AGAR|nr:hypothetical protein CVT24_010686 [Panaeolus cyanescens]